MIWLERKRRPAAKPGAPFEMSPLGSGDDGTAYKKPKAVVQAT
jgi:hypothetical protein